MVFDVDTLKLVRMALEEDHAYEDITTGSLEEFDKPVTARVFAKSPGVISGIAPFLCTFNEVDSSIEIDVLKEDGSHVNSGDDVMLIKGSINSILRAERTALNFIQRLSGIASLTALYVAELDGTGVTLLDTRKTTPGMRMLEKKAVKDGGGTNHRMHLADMSMIKDNHIDMAGGIEEAVNAVKKNHPATKIELEVKNLEELKIATGCSVDVVMLDNFDLSEIPEAVKMVKGKIKLEISGNVEINNIREKAVKGINYISVGALTHSFSSLDLSLRINSQE